MQDTRLTRLIDTTTGRLLGWLQNPWRRLSVVLISLLLGNFLGTAISTIAGQRGSLDIYVAAILAGLCELLSRITYRNRTPGARSLFLETANAIKIGLIYSLFVEAFKLGS